MAPEREPASSSQNSPERPGLLYILFSVLGVLWLFSQFRAPHNYSRESIHPQDTPEDEYKSGKATPRGMLMAQPPRNTENTRERRKRKTPWWEIAAVLIALGLLVVNIFLWCATKKAAEAAKGAADTAINSFNMAKRHAEDTDEAIFGPQPSADRLGGAK